MPVKPEVEQELKLQQRHLVLRSKEAVEVQEPKDLAEPDHGEWDRAEAVRPVEQAHLNLHEFFMHLRK